MNVYFGCSVGETLYENHGAFGAFQKFGAFFWTSYNKDLVLVKTPVYSIMCPKTLVEISKTLQWVSL